MSKVFERIFQKKISNFITSKFSPLQFQEHSQSPIFSFENDESLGKKHLYIGDRFSVILMDLSQAFDRINHFLLLAKLEACRFFTSSLNLLQSYLCNRFQKPKGMGHIVTRLTFQQESTWFYFGFFALQHIFKDDPISCLRQFLTTESPLKIIKNAVYFTLKAPFVLSYIFVLNVWLCRNRP